MALNPIAVNDRIWYVPRQVVSPSSPSSRPASEVASPSVASAVSDLYMVAEIDMMRYLATELVLGVENVGSSRCVVAVTIAGHGASEELLHKQVLDPNESLYDFIEGVYRLRIYTDGTLSIYLAPIKR